MAGSVSRHAAAADPRWPDLFPGKLARAMKSLFKKLLRLISDEAGPTAVEYATMVMLVVLVCLTGITAIGQLTATRFQQASTSIQDTIDALP